MEKKPAGDNKKAAGTEKKKTVPVKKKQVREYRSPVLRKMFAWAVSIALGAALYYYFEAKRYVFGFSVYGIDVSKYQGKVDWQRVKNDGVDFAFVKASEGAELQDEMFMRNWTELKKTNIVRGAYHFFIPTADPWGQVANFRGKVKLEEGDLPPVLDVEMTNDLPKEELRARIRYWLTAIEKSYKVKPIIYANESYFKDYLAGHFDGYTLWVAKYRRGSNPDLTRYGTKWDFWQYSETGSVWGIKGNVDLNVFAGTYRELISHCINGEKLIIRMFGKEDKKDKIKTEIKKP